MNSFFKFIVGTVPWITLGILFAMFFTREAKRKNGFLLNYCNSFWVRGGCLWKRE